MNYITHRLGGELIQIGVAAHAAISKDDSFSPTAVVYMADYADTAQHVFILKDLLDDKMTDYYEIPDEAFKTYRDLKDHIYRQK